jgi:glucan phosphoethanolaminetransferase (alkaline phosphatase superfamily)
MTLSQTPEGYLSKDIYILSYIQKSAKRIFPILFWCRIFWGYNIQILAISKYNIHYCLTDLSVESNDITALVSLEQKHYFHLWGLQKPLVIFSVPTRENNVFLLSFHRTVMLHFLSYILFSTFSAQDLGFRGKICHFLAAPLIDRGFKLIQ